MRLFLLGTSFKKSSLELRESFAASRKRTDHFARHLKTELGASVFILSTCNRYEIYLPLQDEWTFEIDEARRIFLRSFELKTETYEQYFYERSDEDALRHLLEVAAGLDSQVIGEMQIASQIERSASLALEDRLITHEFYSLIVQVLNSQKIIREAVRPRLPNGSIAHSAYQMLISITGEIRGKNILLVGAGAVIADLLELISNSGAFLRLASTRSRLKAEALSLRYGSPVMTLAEAKLRLSDTDILISATASPYPIFHTDEFRRLARALVILDLALPRDIAFDVKYLKNVQLFNLDDVGAFVQQTNNPDLDLNTALAMSKTFSQNLWNAFTKSELEKALSH